MGKLLGPDFISLQVRNLSASRTFYTELLGLTIDERFNSPDFVLFDTNTIPFALSGAKVNLDEAPQPGWGVTLWIDCDTVNELHTGILRERELGFFSSPARFFPHETLGSNRLMS